MSADTPDDIVDLLRRGAAQPGRTADTDNLLRGGHRRRRRRRAGMAALGLLLVAVAVPLTDRLARPTIRFADSPAVLTPAAPTLSVLAQPPALLDARALAFFQDQPDVADPTQARLALERDGRRYYVVPGADGPCLYVIAADERGASICDHAGLLASQGVVSLSASFGSADRLVAGLVGDGWTSLEFAGGSTEVVNNVFVIANRTIPGEAELAGPAGRRTVSAGFAPVGEEGPAVPSAVDAVCPADFVASPAEPTAVTSPAAEVTVTGLPAGFAWITDLAGKTIAAEYDGASGVAPAARHPEVQGAAAVGDWATSTTYAVVTTVQGPADRLCQDLRAAAAGWSDALAEDEPQAVRVHGRTGVLRPPGAGGASPSSLLLWLESEELMVQLLAENVEPADLLRIAEGLEVTGPTPPAVPVLDEPTGTRLVLTNDRDLTVVDVDSGQVTTTAVAQLAGGDPLYRLVRRGGGLVFYGQADDTEGAIYVVDPGNPSAPRLLGNAWLFVPSAIEDRVWLATLDPSSAETVRALSAVREVTLDGEVTVPDTPPPGGRWPVGAVHNGLVFEALDDRLEVWDPISGQIVETLAGGFVAATGNTVASAQGEYLHLTETGGGAKRLVHTPPEGSHGYAGYAGAFSPDGATLAVPVALDDSPDPAYALALVDVAGSVATVVPGGEMDGTELAWSPSGEWVFFAAEDGGLGAYKLGAPTSSRLDVEIGPFFALAAVR